MVKKLYFCDDKYGIMKDFLRNMPQFLVSGTVVAAVLYLTLAPKPLPDNDINWFKHTDKIVHAVMMAGVYLAVALDYIKHRRQPCGLAPGGSGIYSCRCDSVWRIYRVASGSYGYGARMRSV